MKQTQNSINELLKRDFEKNKIDIKIKTVIEILHIYNCRISEVLEAEWKNFFPQQFLILRGKKKSENIIITDRLILQAIANFNKSHNRFIFHYVKYKDIYNYLKNTLKGEISRFKKRKNNKVTHYFRYSNVAKLNEEGYIKTILHHKSVKSQKYYINKSKE